MLRFVQIFLILFISIHAPLTRSDPHRRQTSSMQPYFNPRPSYEERPRTALNSPWTSDFNPRPSYEERLFGVVILTNSTYFNPRPSYEERLCFSLLSRCNGQISIHAPLTRSDGKQRGQAAAFRYFNPRPSYEERRNMLP